MKYGNPRSLYRVYIEADGEANGKANDHEMGGFEELGLGRHCNKDYSTLRFREASTSERVGSQVSRHIIYAPGLV